MPPIYCSTIVIETPIKRGRFFLYILRLLFLILMVVFCHHLKTQYFDSTVALSPYYANRESHKQFRDECQISSLDFYYLQMEFENLKAQFEALPKIFVEILDLYSSDRTGLFDYAAEYAGGLILSIPDTIPYPSNKKIHIFGLFSVTMDSQPHTILKTANLPGDCFAFYGSAGRIVISLGLSVFVTNFTLEHIRIGDELNSAPKDFEVLGIDGAFEDSFGNFTYDIGGRMVQTYQVVPKKKSFKTIELRIFSNHGNPKYTCVYRFRAHSY